MHRKLPFKALKQRNFPMNISFQSAYQLQDFAKKFLYRYFFNVQTKKPDQFPNLCLEYLFLTGLTLSTLSICEDELLYMWCLTTLYATKLVFPVKPVLTHLTNPEFSPDLLWTLLEWNSPLTWWRKQLQNLCTFHGLDRMPEHEANIWTTVFIVHRPYFQHLKTRHGIWMENLPSSMIHRSPPVSKPISWNLNNVPPPATNIHHTSIGPSHTLEIIPKTQGYSGFKFKSSRNPCHRTTSWLHQRLIPRRSGPMGRFSVPSPYWKSPLYCHQPRLFSCIYITTHVWS